MTRSWSSPKRIWGERGRLSPAWGLLGYVLNKPLRVTDSIFLPPRVQEPRLPGFCLGAIPTKAAPERKQEKCSVTEGARLRSTHGGESVLAPGLTDAAADSDIGNAMRPWPACLGGQPDPDSTANFQPVRTDREPWRARQIYEPLFFFTRRGSIRRTDRRLVDQRGRHG